MAEAGRGALSLCTWNVWECLQGGGFDDEVADASEAWGAASMRAGRPLPPAEFCEEDTAEPDHTPGDVSEQGEEPSSAIDKLQFEKDLLDHYK